MSSKAEAVDISVEQLGHIVKQIIIKSLGYEDDEEAAIITSILLDAQVRGNSQGVIKVISNGVPPSSSRARGKERDRIIVEKETKLSARLNGQGISGMIVMDFAVKLAVSKAKEHGMALVASHGTSSGTGAIGFFAREIARKKLVGIVLSQSPELVCPYGSYEPIFGTNPFAIGIPRESAAAVVDDTDSHSPLVLDMATSAYAWYAVKEKQVAGEPLPDDVAYDSHGYPTTDPQAALAGALRTFDRSYKGSHLALMIEILGGALAGGDVENKWEGKNWGNLVLVLDPELVGSLAEFQTKVERLLSRVKSAKRLPPERGEAAVSLPGERSELRAQQAYKTGRVSIDRSLYQGLMQEFNKHSSA